MAFSRPTLSDIFRRIRAGILSRLTNEQLRRSDAEVYGRVLAGASHELHGHLQYIASQVIYDTAEDEYLDRWASIWLKTPRIAAFAAAGFATFTGLNGAVIEIGTILVRNDGEEFETTEEGVIALGVALVPIVATLPGAFGNTLGNEVLTVSEAIDNVASEVTVDENGLTGGADQESSVSLRARLLARIKQPPHGGADYDYITWALEVPGVTRAWVYPNELGLGTVTLRFVRDNDANLIPDAGEVETVQDYIDAVRPVTAGVNVFAPVAVPLNFTIAVTPNTAAVQQAVEAELRDLIQRESEPAGTILLSRIREAISISAGESNYEMTAPMADVVNTLGNMTTFGVITWA